MARTARRLRAPELRPSCPPTYVPWASTRRVPPLRGIVGQERALRALRTGLALRARGYNVFVTGISGTGRTSITADAVRRLTPRPTRDLDFVYVMNFRDPDRPILLTFPRGGGMRFQRDMEGLVRGLRRALPRAVGTGAVGKRKDRVTADLQAEERRLVKAFEARARSAKFVVHRKVLDNDEEEVELHYLVQGRPYPMDRLEELSRRGRLLSREVKSARAGYAELRADLEGVMRRGRRIESRMSRALGEIEDREAERLLDERIRRLAARHPGEKVARYLAEVREEILRELDLFLDDGGIAEPRMGDPFASFRVNVLQEARLREPPPIVEANPTYRNVFGALERVERPGGALVADFLTIRAGALLRADGGVLVLNARDVLDEPYVYRALRRLLRSGRLEIQDPESVSFSPTALKPEPIELDVKVVLVAEEDVYEDLWEDEEELDNLFKLKVEFDDTLPFDRATARAYAGFVSRVCRQEGLPHLDRAALRRLLDECRRRTGRSHRITARMSHVVDLVRESAHVAKLRQARAPLVRERDVAGAVSAQHDRQSLVEDKLREEIHDGVVQIRTTGRAVGTLNSLVVFDVGGHTFGKPSRVTASVAPGNGAIVDIERESNLSGRTHDKGVLVMSGYLRRLFAEQGPLSLLASICMEQSYGGVDGDSASLVECLALLSALAEVPLLQGYAVTGALDQHGAVLAVGGVTEKIEGFFEVGRRRMPRPFGVVMPATNDRELMVSDAVVKAARRGEFEVRVVTTVDEALSVMARPVAPSELLRRAARRLEEFRELAAKRDPLALQGRKG